MPDIFVYVGPYAEWEVQQEHFDVVRGAAWNAFWEVVYRERETGALTWNIGLNPGYCCMPRRPRSENPRRPLFLEWRMTSDKFALPDEDAIDWPTVNREAELEWFRQAFTDELRQVSEVFRFAPRFRWGLVHWAWL